MNVATNGDRYKCTVWENPSNPQVHKNVENRSHFFSVRVRSLSADENSISLSFKFEDKGKLIIPSDYTGIIDVAIDEIADDVKNYDYEKWIGKRVRFIGEVDSKLEDEYKLYVGIPGANFGDDFKINVSGFDPHGEVFRKYEYGES